MAATRPPLIAFDVDEVLVNLREPMCAALNSVTGQTLAWHHWTSYDMSTNYGLALEDCLEVFTTHRVLEQAVVDPEAAACLRHAQALGYRTAAITARGWHPKGRQITQACFKAHGLAVDHLKVVDLGQSKRGALAELAGRVLYLLDDHPDHVADAERFGVTVPVLMDRPWNRHCAPRFRVASLGEFAQLLVPAPGRYQASQGARSQQIRALRAPHFPAAARPGPRRP